jgi:hypothetical protein
LRAEAASPWPAHRAFAKYVAGELAAGEDPQTATREYVAAIHLAQRCGATFVEGVATVGLASVWTATGAVEQAVRGYQVLLAYWLRTGNHTQLWTTVRNSAALLADLGHNHPAAVLYAAADDADSAATLAPDAAERARRARSSLNEALGPAEVTRVAACTARMSVAEVVRMAVDALGSLPGTGADPSPPQRGRHGPEDARVVHPTSGHPD